MAADEPIIKAHHIGGDNTEYYTCPMKSFLSKMNKQMLQYCYENYETRVSKGRATCGDKKTLQGNYSWIPEGWAMEIREGVNKKKFKFFLHKSSGVRLTSKDDVEVFEGIVGVPKKPLPYEEDVPAQDVLLFDEPFRKRKTPRACEDPGAAECDTSSQDNMTVQLDFYTGRLSAGWVKETRFRPNRQGKDTYFIDPCNQRLLRTKKAAEKYFWTEEYPKDSWKETLTQKYKYLLDDEDLDGQHKHKEKKSKTSSTEDDEAMISLEAKMKMMNPKKITEETKVIDGSIFFPLK